MQNLAVLDAARERGYAIAYGHHAHERIVAAAVQLGKRNRERRAEAIDDLQFFDDAYNLRPDSDDSIELRSIAVPVYRKTANLPTG